MWEISENLHCGGLTALEEAEQIAEWIKLTGVSSQHETKPKNGRPASGINEAVRELGIERNEAHRAVKVARLTPEAKQAAVETGPDNNRKALLEAAQQPPERQAEAVRAKSQSKPTWPASD